MLSSGESDEALLASAAAASACSYLLWASLSYAVRLLIVLSRAIRNGFDPVPAYASMTIPG